MSVEQNEAIPRRVHQQVLDQEHLDPVDEPFAPDYANHHPLSVSASRIVVGISSPIMSCYSFVLA